MEEQNNYPVLDLKMEIENVNQKNNQGMPDRSNMSGNMSNMAISREQGNIRKNTSPFTDYGPLVPKTYKIPEKVVRQIESAAYWKRKKIQHIVTIALFEYLSTLKPEELTPIPNDVELQR